MNKQPKSRSAFTLIEMLVVIVIMSLLATALVSALKSAQRQAQAALCQARLKNLHQACMNFLADTGHYPYAGSYEYLDLDTLTYSEHKGWVAWIRKDGKTNSDGTPIDPWAEDDSVTHAADYIHAGWRGENARRSIKEGSIFKYATRDTSTYFCKGFQSKFGVLDKDLVHRSYAMNSWFGSRRMELSRGRLLLDFQKGDIEPSRMGYIIELQSTKDTGDKNIGEQAKKDVAKRKPIADDSVWEHADDERYGLYHRKTGKMHGHVIFVDGHIESMTDQPDKQGDDYATQNTKIGDATH